jgi:hypothetical protein
VQHQADSVDALKKLALSLAQRREQIELERQHEERNPTFEFGTNTVLIDLISSGIGKSGKVN